MSFAKIRPRRGTLEDWVLENPILDQGEIAFEYPNTGIGTGYCRLKVGDGIRRYSELPYSLDATSAASIVGGSVADSHLISVKFDDCDLTSVDFTRANLVECLFNNSVLNGTDFSYSTIDYCNFNYCCGICCNYRKYDSYFYSDKASWLCKEYNK